MLNNVKCILIEILEELSDKDFENFKWYLKNEADEKKMRVSSLDGADRKETIDKMIGKQAWQRKKEELKGTTEEELKRTTEEEHKGTAEEELKGTAEEELKGTVEEELLSKMASDAKGTTVRQILTTSLKKLSTDQFKKFKRLLCKTPMNELVCELDYYDKPNTFQRNASLEEVVEALIQNLGRTYALRAAATVMEKVPQRELAQELARETDALKPTHHGLKKTPKGKLKGLTLIGAGTGGIYLGYLAASAAGASVMGPVILAITSGAAILKGIKLLRN
ncbi:unnamed protein product [Lepidochelys kempii]